MSHGASPLAAFHLIGDRSGLDPDHSEFSGLRPALFGSYGDLSSIRHDYPLVLVTQSADGSWVRSLADIIDDVLRKIAEPGVTGETTRRQVLSLEQVIRTLLANGHKGSLTHFWEAARRQLSGPEEDSDESMNASLQQARDALGLDGEIVNCDHELAAKLMSRAWQESEALKAENLRYRVDRLTQKLSNILQADYMHSPQARAANHLESSMGSANQSVFDFQEMARVLRSAPVANAMPESRKKRIRAAISVLESQHFVATSCSEEISARKIYNFDFVDCHKALAEYRKRLPEMAALVRAISIAQLELENRYDESRHQEFFDSFDENCLGPADLALFPSYLVCLQSVDKAGQMAILEVLRAGLPFKMVAQTDDILEDDSIAKERLSFGIRGQQLARMAMGLEQVFVLQAANSSLYRMRDSLLQGMSNDRPALFSIYSAAATARAMTDGENASLDEEVIPPYLAAAAATESRAFPCFVYDPAAGSGLACQFHLSGNPEPDKDWPAHGLSYEDTEHKLQNENLLFTLLDFVAADPRFSQRFVCVPRADWVDEMIPAGEFLGLSGKERGSRIPYILLLDQQNNLHRAVFDERLIDAAERSRNAWRNLQELAGIKNSHVNAAMALAQKAWNEEKEKLGAQLAASAKLSASQPIEPESITAEPQVNVRQEETVVEQEEPVSSGDDPWIETIRCTTCNECTQLNDRMFAYDADKRAYVADPDAGTFRELVEAAESCQVAIIHPGKPRNPDEPGLEELMERAQAFN